jgi:hypothetical protein
MTQRRRDKVEKTETEVEEEARREKGEGRRGYG